MPVAGKRSTAKTVPDMTYYVFTTTTTTVLQPFFRTTRLRRCQKRTYGLYGARED